MSLAHHVSSLWNSKTPPMLLPCPAPTPQPMFTYRIHFHLLRYSSGPNFLINISIISPTWEASSFCEPHRSCIFQLYAVVHLCFHYSFSFRLYFSHGLRQCIDICFPCSYWDILYTTPIRQKRNEPK